SKSASRTRNRQVAAARCPASSQICASTRSSGTVPSADAAAGAAEAGTEGEAQAEAGFSVSNMYLTLAAGADKDVRSWGVGDYRDDCVEAARPAVRAGACGQPGAGLPDPRWRADADGGAEHGPVRRSRRGGTWAGARRGTVRGAASSG